MRNVGGINFYLQYKKGEVDQDVVSRMKMIMEELELKGEDRKVALEAKKAKEVLLAIRKGRRTYSCKCGCP